MKAFLSHSSKDKHIVSAVYKALERDCVWLDQAEIEWGDKFLDRIEEGIKSATDFVLFWSKFSALSNWVELELNMAFILALKQKAIRLKVIKLDNTELPLRLEPYHYLSVINSANPVEDIVTELKTALKQPAIAVRHRFVNRNSELERIEEVINNPLMKVIFLHGFQGIGKSALARESLRRLFAGASIDETVVGIGMGPVELALKLHNKAFGQILPEGTSIDALSAIKQAVTEISNRGQFLLLRDCQHWLDSDGLPEEPLETLLLLARSLDATSRRPIFLTTTRRPRISIDHAPHVATVRVPGLENSHVAALIGLWYELSLGKDLDVDQALKVAPAIHGHPVAAKIAASLIEQYGVSHLLEYPRELVALRRDLARTLIGDLSIKEHTATLMETLAIIRAQVPQKVLESTLPFGVVKFQDAVAEATIAGLAEINDTGHLTIHPLIDDYFWRSHLSRVDYKEKAEGVAAKVHQHLLSLPTESAAFVELLPAVFRLFTIAGNLEQAQDLRRDLSGELANVAIIHYNRRTFDLAEAFIREVLIAEPYNRKMRQYLARIHIRRRRWTDADELIEGLLRERPSDTVSRHLKGWRLLRAQEHKAALEQFTDVLAHRSDHVASLRDAADCLYRLDRPGEALEFLERAKAIESNNSYTLDLEARIYEDTGNFERALIAVRGAVNRDPSRWALRHRLARILNRLGSRQEAIPEARTAVQLDSAQFLPRNTLVSLLLDEGELEEAEEHLVELKNLVANKREREIYEHSSALLLSKRGHFEEAVTVIQRQIERESNLAASYGLLADIRLRQYSHAADKALASSKLYLQEAGVAIVECEAQVDHRSEIVSGLRERLEMYQTQS